MFSAKFIKVAVLLFEFFICTNAFIPEPIPMTTADPTRCTPDTCNGNGHCELQNGLAVCICRKGAIGTRCQISDPCSRKPCGVNGACFPVITNQNSNLPEQASYHCQCYTGFNGQNCENVPAKPCTSSPCLNHGICVNKNNSWDYYCICIGTYTGKDCATYLDQCANHKCKNEALCIPSSTSNGYTCSCKNGYFGEFCENEYNECKIEVNGLTTSPCFNNGTCFDLVDAYYCECNGPWSGKNCEHSLFGPGNHLNNYLLPAASAAALLPIIPAAFLLLKKGYAGNQNVNPCNAHPCPVGSECLASGANFVCKCKEGFFGSQCLPDPCKTHPCKYSNSECIPVEGSVINAISKCQTHVISAAICSCLNSDGSHYAGLNC